MVRLYFRQTSAKGTKNNQVHTKKKRMIGFLLLILQLGAAQTALNLAHEFNSGNTGDIDGHGHFGESDTWQKFLRWTIVSPPHCARTSPRKLRQCNGQKIIFST